MQKHSIDFPEVKNLANEVTFSKIPKSRKNAPYKKNALASTFNHFEFCSQHTNGKENMLTYF
jgi:5-methylcytosine-specific restriction enzyme subunit McrC